MGSKASRFLPSIMDYSSFSQHPDDKKRDLYDNGLPRAPKKKKKDIYDPSKYEKLNERIENTPDNLLNTDCRELVKYLTESCVNDLAKVHALFYWMASRSLFATFHPDAKKHSPIWYMNKIFTGHTNFAHFFYVLCWHADIPCVIIGGITKNSAYKIGFPDVAPDMAAQWNAVFVVDDWYLANIQWACIYANEPNDWERVVIVTKKQFSPGHDSRCNISSTPKKPKTKDEYFHRVNDYYFLTDPEELIWTHFPNKKQWQLLNDPVTLDEFLNHFYVREQFYLLDMSLTEKSHTDCVLLVDENREVRIEFALPPKCSSYRFKYTLSHHWSSTWHPVKQQNLLQQGRYEVKDDRFLLTLHLTSEGTYKLDIFGSEQRDCDFFLICSYVVKCSHTEEGPALPKTFFMGYGSSVKPLMKTIKTKDGRIKLPFPVERDYNIIHELRDQEEVLLDGCSLLRMIDDVDDKECSSIMTMIIELRLPKPGRYSLKVYGKKKDELSRNLCNYCITYTPDEKTPPMLEGSTTKDSLVSHQNRITVLTHPGSFIQTNLETLNIIFRSEYQLSCKLFSHDHNTQSTTKTSVLHDMATNECQINVTVPISGDYSLKIFTNFGKAVSGEGVGRVYEVHSYRIRKVDSDRFPINGFRLSAAHIVGTFETDQSVINISQSEITNETLLVLQYQKSSLYSNLVKVSDEDGGSNIEATLPQIGDYLLSLLKKDAATGLIGNVTRYLLRRKQVVEIKDSANDSNPQLQESKKECAEKESELNQNKEEVIVKGNEIVNKPQTPIKTTETAKTEDSNTEEKRPISKTVFKPIQGGAKPILKDGIIVEEMKKPETEKKLSMIENNNLSDEVQKKTIDFSKNINFATDQAKDNSTSIADIENVVGVDTGKSLEAIKLNEESKIPKLPPKSTFDERTIIEVDTETSPKSIKPNQNSKIPKLQSKSTSDEQTLAEVDTSKSVESISDQPSKIPDTTPKSVAVNQVTVEVGKSVESIKNDQPSEIRSPDKEENENKDKTPKEGISKPITEIPAPIPEKQTAKPKTDEPKKPEVSKDSLLRELENAILKRNPERLKSAIDRSEKHLSGDILDKAKKLLDLLLAKKDLTHAYDNRDKELLGKALEEVRRVDVDNELKREVDLAEKMYRNLCGLDDLRSIIGTFNSRAVSEIKSYSNPPKAVIVVMKAAFLILNEPEDQLKDWKQIRALLRSDKKPFLRRILHCNPRWLSSESVAQAEINLGQLNAGDISTVSEMAKVLFAWVKIMIEGVKNQEMNINSVNLEK